MSDRNLAALRQIAEGVHITSSAISWFGTIIGRRAGRAPAEAVDDSHLASSLRDCLYTHYYSIGRPVLVGEASAWREASMEESLSPPLHIANPGTGRRERGWRFVAGAIRVGAIVAEKDGLSVTVAEADAETVSGEPVSEGCELSLRLPAGAMSISPGFYVAYSNACLDYARPLTRIYLNVTPAGGPWLLHSLCTALNEACFPFDLKVASEGTSYHRADVAVLYVPRVLAMSSLETVRNVIASSPGALRPIVPALVHKVSDGIGVADCPSSGESFGLDRCRIIAAALVSARGRHNGDERLGAVAAAFEAEGLSLARPHLGPRQEEIYALA